MFYKLPDLRGTDKQGNSKEQQSIGAWQQTLAEILESSR